ncbi:head maturation protease, ClpP-related [Mycobacterium kyogaense]|uniref:head maturation protease, ClpP-related n=1 Tax=Mycobacterium kyogaense TaxID=2212479 RepID=UPI000DABD052|nr:head maturation protease, ClpP-related [Mycobacterium kyogaense]
MTSFAAASFPLTVPGTGGHCPPAPWSSGPNAAQLATPGGSAPRPWFKWATAQAGTSTPSATLHIYDVIGADPWFGGIDVNELVREIEALDAAAELAVRINSPGGAAWDGLTLANAIMRHPGKTATHVDGLAASAASLVALAGDRVVISKYGQMMLHNARLSVMGATVEELAEASKVGAKLNASMAEFYADRAGGDVAQWARAMQLETWYSAEEAKTAGLATEIDATGQRSEIEAAAASSIAKAAAMYPGRHTPGSAPHERAVAIARARRTRRTRTPSTSNERQHQ